MKKKHSKAAWPTGQNITKTELQDHITKRAYEIWEACGCPHGCEQEHWLRAEFEMNEMLGKQPGSAQSTNV